jgi:hypothetical protein
LVYIAVSVRNMKTALSCFLLVTATTAEIHQNPGGTTPLAHQKYIHVVSEADSPIHQTYIKSKDGLYIAAATRTPKGGGGVIPPSSSSTARRAAEGWNNWWAGREAITVVRSGNGSSRKAMWWWSPTTGVGI